MMAKTPAMLEALRDFALGDCGPDEMRYKAAQAVSDAGLLPSGKARMWLKGKWQEVLFLGIEIYNEPNLIHQPQVEDLLLDALDNLREDNPEEAESLLKQALVIEPNAPDLMFNLASAYQQQRRFQEFEDLIRLIHQNHPDYGFARLGLAKLHIDHKEYKAAEELLKPMLQFKRLHFQEFVFLCQTQVELCLAQKEFDGARSWLSMWEKIDPDEPDLVYWKRRLQQPKRLRWQ